MHLKIQQEIMKAAYKRDNKIGKETFLYYYDELEKLIAVVNSTYIFLINKVDFYLDLNIFKGRKINIRSFLDAADEAEVLDELYECNRASKHLYVLKNPKDEKIYLDINILKKFGKPENLVFYGTCPNAPVYIKNLYGYLLGLILPVYFREDNNV